jgi:hypothetical protein
LTDSDGDGFLDKDDNLPYLANPDTQRIPAREACPHCPNVQNESLLRDLKHLTPKAPPDKAINAMNHAISETGRYGGCDEQNLCGLALDAICDLANTHPDPKVEDHAVKMCGIGRAMRDGTSWGWWWWPFTLGPKELKQAEVIQEQGCLFITEKTGGWYHWWRWPWYIGWWVKNVWPWWWYPVEQVKQEIKCISFPVKGKITKQFQIHLVFQPVWWWWWGWWLPIDP